jgi:diadenosine tetraphosphate (Ap4A) HIT family hydrolase
MYHYRKTRNSYVHHNSGDKQLDDCTFCNEAKLKKNFVEEGKTMFVIPNRVFYDIFEGRKVLDHKMIIPKQHRESFDDFTAEEALEMLQTSAKYEKQGYNVYARGVGSIGRTVNHQHTHLIKTDNEPAKAFFYIRKPYYMIKL